jgi:hypothetical protein
MSTTYEDIIDARETALEQGKSVSHVELTDEAIEDMAGDTKIADGERVASAGSVGMVSAFDVHEGDSDVLVTDDGTEIEL